MLKKRIIPCLDIKDGRTVKGVNFENIRDAGDPIELAKRYEAEGADELVFLDITASIENRKTLSKLVQEIASAISIPFTVGGGIGSLSDAQHIINSGADKISINSAAIANPALIAAIAAEFGNQCVVLAVDTQWVGSNWKVFSKGGRINTQLNTLAWIKEATTLGAGEILLTSMQHDGTKNGFALELTQAVSECCNVPVIASGGAGTMQHFADIFEQSNATGALAASVFHYGEIPIPQLKSYLKTKNIPLR